MDNLPDKDGMNINVKHKTWTPDDQIKYEKEMIKYRLVISAGLIGGSIIIIFIATLLFKILK